MQNYRSFQDWAVPTGIIHTQSMISLTFHASEPTMPRVPPMPPMPPTPAIARDAEVVMAGLSEPPFSADLCDRDRIAGRFLFRYPEEQLRHYAELRGRSELGRIFHVANGLHEHIDAMVILGSSQCGLGVRALMQACCDPYHNELSRADRGSKPRVYFAGDGYDNDATASLIDRLRANGKESTPPETRFAILAILDQDSGPVIAALPHFIHALQIQLGDQGAKWLPRLTIPIVNEMDRTDGTFDEVLASLRAQFCFTIPRSLSGPRTIFSPAALLPAAFLGLDCMKLLEGAASINEDFLAPDPNDSLVLRYRRTWERMADQCGRGLSPIRVWEKSLQAAADWVATLRRKRNSSCDEGGVPVRWTVRSQRTDRLLVHENPEISYASKLHDDIQRNTASLLAKGLPAIELSLPEIDTHVLGQLFQLMMIMESIAED